MHERLGDLALSKLLQVGLGVNRLIGVAFRIAMRISHRIRKREAEEANSLRRLSTRPGSPYRILSEPLFGPEQFPDGIVEGFQAPLRRVAWNSPRALLLKNGAESVQVMERDSSRPASLRRELNPIVLGMGLPSRSSTCGRFL
jgi:hypothetical protein